MAKIALNSALKGIRGMIDGWIYKRFGDRVILARHGVSEAPPTAGQLAQREQFRLASAYAVAALSDPTLRAFYELAAKERPNGTTVRAVALGDYFTAPVITQIDVTGYHGVIGGTIAVTPTPQVEVAALTVTLRDGSDSSVLETGAAASVDGKWVYAATVAAPAGHPVAIEAKAVDHAGNERSLTAQWTA